MKHLECIIKIFGPEEDPGNIDKVEGDEPGQQGVHPVSKLLPSPVDNHCKAMKGTPKDKGPSGTMPDTAKQESRKEVEVSAALASSIATQRNIEIISQEPGERYVPSSPEVLDRSRFIG